MRPFRSRANYAHVAPQYIEELREFVEIGLPEENAHCSPSRIVGGGPTRISFLTPPYSHGPKFQHAKHAAVESYPLLDKEHRTTAGSFNHERDQKRER